MTITTLSTPDPGLQYWFTMSVTREGGVFEEQVMAPRLPARLFKEQACFDQSVPPPLQTPELSNEQMAALALLFLVMLLAFKKGEQA